VKVLVTGANGFLGRQVVAELARRGHRVRALVRPAADIGKLNWDSRVDVFRGDLRNCPDLLPAFDGVDALIHLAATVVGDAEAQLAETTVGTTRLLRAMAMSQTKKLLLASSFSVYDFNGAGGTLTEQTPLDPRIYERDGYAIAKFWQERITRDEAAQHGWDLTVLRPGFIWGKGNDYLACLGQSFGPVHLVLGPLTRLPLTHVTNCADCFVTALENSKAVGQTLNIVDDDSVRAWEYMGTYLRGSQTPGVRIPIPYLLCQLFVHAAHRTSKWIFNGKGKLPSLLVPIRFTARFKPLRYPTEFLRNTLGWTPSRNFAECMGLTWKTLTPTAAAPAEDLDTQESPATISPI
jgi:nucleoside-diphosphate-sugar epimerase